MMSEAGSHDDGGSSMVFGNERHNRDNIFRDGSSNVPRALRGGRMPFRRPELQDGETTVAVFCRKHGLNPDYFRRKVRKHGLQALRQVTSEKVYHLADFEELLAEKKQSGGKGKRAEQEKERKNNHEADRKADGEKI